MQKERTNSRSKGHTLERKVTNDLKVFFPFARTSRNGSKITDDCGIDIIGVPFNIQIKNGYNKIKFKFEDEFKYTVDKLKLVYPQDDKIHTYPYIFIHKKTGVKGKIQPELFQVTMTYDTFIGLISKIYNDRVGHKKEDGSQK